MEIIRQLFSEKLLTDEEKLKTGKMKTYEAVWKTLPSTRILKE